MATSIFHENFPQVKQLEEKADQASYIIGLDLHKKTVAVSVIDKKNPRQPIFQRKRMKNEKLLETINGFSGKKILVAEASYGWVPLKEAVVDMEEVTLILFDPRKTSAWAESSGVKNDKLDAEVLAYACLQGGIPRLTVYQPTKEDRENFKLVNLRDRLVKQRTSVLNQLRAIERDYGVNIYTGETVMKSEIVKEMENILLDQLGILKQKICEIEKKMKKISKDDGIVSILETLPGIGPITAFALRYKIGEISRFKDAKHLCSYFGFAVRQYNSGDHCVTGKISKRGDTLIRKLIIQGAQTVRAVHPEYLKLYFPNLANDESMKDKKHANKVVVALGRKQLTFIYHCWRKRAEFSIDEYRRRREQSLTNSLSVSKSCRTR